MSKVLQLEQLFDNGSQVVGSLDGAEVMIGREPDSGITVESTSVSRNHGRFLSFKDHWFYSDLESTNGSWINGEQTAGGEIRLIRAGDVIQLADTAVKLNRMNGSSSGAFPDIGTRSIIVARNGEFVDEFPVPEYGRALVIGGNQANLPIAGMMEDYPALVVERRGDEVVIFGMSQEHPILLDGEPVESTTSLTDRSMATVAEYLVIYNYPTKKTLQSQMPPMMENLMQPAQATPPQASAGYDPTTTRPMNRADLQQAQSGAQGQDGSHWLGGGEEQRATIPPRSVTDTAFGQNIPVNDPLEAESTISIDPAELERRISGFESHPAMRHEMRDSGAYEYRSAEDRIVMVVGLLLLVALLGSVTWLFLLN